MAKARCGLKIYRWTFMTNRYPILVLGTDLRYWSGRGHAFCSGSLSARYFGKKYAWKGHVWESRYTNRLIADERYFRQCAQYIEENPVKARMVTMADEYPWSSARFYSQGYKDPLTDKDPYTEPSNGIVERCPRRRSAFHRKTCGGTR